MTYIRESFEKQMFDNILYHRFNDVKCLQDSINKIELWVDDVDVLSHRKFELEDVSMFYCDLDIYYLVDRNGDLYVTEIGYTYE